MYYYEVLVGALTYHGEKALTYSAEAKLKPGAIVKITLRTKPTLGVIHQEVPKPSFTVKAIAEAPVVPPLPPQLLELMDWLHAYYPAPLGAVVRQFVPPSDVLSKLETEKVEQQSKVEYEKPPLLSQEQNDALQTIQGPGTFLLHGVTGSGKSRVYIELTDRVMANNKSALILTPEIGLTAQLTASFQQRFGKNNVYVLHSQLTVAERRDIYYKLLQREHPVIVIGPRSALFSPLRNLGLIVLDEAHDGAYKNESAPHYQSSRVAAKLATLHNATLVLGSATPTVEDYYLALTKNRPIITMQGLAKGGDTQADIDIVDLRKHELFSRTPILSDKLITKVRSAIQQNEQALIFLNRRGTANVVLCQNCGWQALCPNCDLALAYHSDHHELRCHICGFTSQLAMSCPICNHTEILLKSVGTKAVVDTLTKLFPAARIRRFDTDLKKTERLENHLESLARGDVDIIVGTQMISKGLDLPKLSVVGIVNADSSLLIPDYSAAERTYQLIRQVVGRVGRGHRAGNVVIQTYDPENITLLSAVHRKWQPFYESEIKERKTYKFPPFIHLLKLRVLRSNSATAEKAAAELSDTILQRYPDTIVEGPAPSFHPREHGKYSWQILIKDTSRSKLVKIISDLPSGWTYDIDPNNLL
jgi:primosomal protein N' (replication factor Y)